MLLRTVATSELVVPRSMPTARRWRCGSADWPGSAICSSAISVRSRGRAAGVDRLVRIADAGGEALDEHQLPHQRGGTDVIPGLVERVFERRQQFATFLVHRRAQRGKRLRIAARLVERLAPFH